MNYVADENQASLKGVRRERRLGGENLWSSLADTCYGEADRPIVLGALVREY